MFGKQKVCFTCSTPIEEKLYEYERYREVYKLSRTDAADKTQFKNICCRTTAFGQTKVEERVKAAGVVSTVNNELRVQNIKEYPTTRITRVKGEGPFKHDDVQLSSNYREKISFQSFGGLRENITTIPERRAHGDKSAVTLTTARMSNRDVLGDLSSYTNGVWTLTDRRTFPKQEEMKEIFNKKRAVIHILCPILSPNPFIITELPAETDVETALISFEALMITPKISFSETLSENNVIKAPKRLLHILKLQQIGKHPSLIDFTEFTMIVTKVYRDSKQKVYIFELRHLPPVQLKRPSLQEEQLKTLVEPKVTKVKKTQEGDVVLSLGEVNIMFRDFELHSSGKVSKEIIDLQRGSILQGVKHQDREFMLSFSRTNIFVLVIIGDFTISGIQRSLITEDNKRAALLQLLDSL